MRGSRRFVSRALASVAALTALGVAAVGSAHAAQPSRSVTAGASAGVPFVADPLPQRSGASPALAPVQGSGPWATLVNQPKLAPGSMELLTDGTVLVHADGSAHWSRLTPDSHGNYLNGTWSPIATMPHGYMPYYFASGVLPDGRMLVEGGEYNGSTPVWQTRGAIYDPLSNRWQEVNPPAGWQTIGDAQSTVLPDGKFMLANCCTKQAALFNPTTLTWTPTGTGKDDINDEEGWTNLPNDKVITVDASDMPNSELYSGGKWTSAGDTPDDLADRPDFELGPVIYSPGFGQALAIGATSANDLYNPATGVWSSGPFLPQINGARYDSADGPAAVLPDGKILIAASPGDFATPTHFWVFDGTTLTQAPDSPNAANDSSFFYRMLVLPTGQILVDDGSQVDLYTRNAKAPSQWAPVVSSLSSTTLTPGLAYTVKGTQLSGLTQGAGYGDDYQANTNYPLVRVTNNKTGVVTYGRTMNMSSFSIAPGTPSSAQFTVPAGTPTGPSKLVVVTNGIASTPINVTIS